jgi:drug/metabolite transporter (DMT)-like permease
MKKLFGAHSALLIATFIFGCNYWISKALMPEYLQPMQIIFLRTWGCSVLFWLTSLFLPRERLDRRDWYRVIGCSLFGVAINQTFFYNGLNLANPVDASIIHVANPVLVLLFSALLGREIITGWKTGGIAMGAAGAAFIVIYGKLDVVGGGSIQGNLYIFINITFWALYLVLVKPLLHKYSVVTVMKWLFLFGFIFSLPFTLPSMDHINWPGFTANAWFYLLYIIIGSTYLAYFLTNFALRTLSPTVTSYYIFLQPMIVSIGAIIMGTSALSVPKILAGILIIAGAWLVSRRSQKVTERD